MIHILLLIILIAYTFGTFVVKVTHPYYEAEERQNITMGWNFPPVPFSSLSVGCVMANDDLCIFHLRNGEEVPGCQHQQFAGRLQCDKDALREGRLTIHLSRLRTEDSGDYLCEIHTADVGAYGQSRLKVTVTTAPPEPPKVERRGRIGLYAGFIAAALTVAALYYKYMREKAATAGVALESEMMYSGPESCIEPVILTVNLQTPMCSDS
ncbi:uncharacterized protein LOC143010679 [Genypterus blacodes]|uniref:uncharacterized protein LOC143010679 n=1 Tax=Genypterus blacodes TaxID=154954 RepID=UPI003F76ED26